MLLFEDKISNNRDAFVQKVIDISSKLGINPDWMMAVINSESNFNPAIRNSRTGAVGLIQILPSTAVDLGTTTADLQHMSNVEQLDWVYKYFYPYRNYINKFEDLYEITFYPNADGKFAGTLSKPDDWRFPGDVYAANRNLDQDEKGYITIADFKNFIYSKIPPAQLAYMQQSNGILTSTKKFTLRNWLPLTGITIAALLIAYGTKMVLTSKSK